MVVSGVQGERLQFAGLAIQAGQLAACQSQPGDLNQGVPHWA